MTRRWMFACLLALPWFSVSAHAEVCSAGGRLTPAVVEILNVLAPTRGALPRRTWTLYAAADFARSHLLPKPTGRSHGFAASVDHASALARSLSPAAAQQLSELAQELGLTAASLPFGLPPVDFVLLPMDKDRDLSVRLARLADLVANQSLRLGRAVEIWPLAQRCGPSSPTQRGPLACVRACLPSELLALPQSLSTRRLLTLPATGKARPSPSPIATWAQHRRAESGTILVVSAAPFAEAERREVAATLARLGRHGLRVYGLGLPHHPDRQAQPKAYPDLGTLLAVLGTTLAWASEEEQLGLFDAAT